MLFGIASATGIFQWVMESILLGILGVIVYVDKILISGSSKQENVERLQVVLFQLLEASLRLKKERSTRSGPGSSRSGLDDGKHG